MSVDKTVLKCMICSAKNDETKKLVEHCREMINHWSEINATYRDVSFVAMGQGINSVPGSGEDAQKVIEEQILNKADFGIAIIETPKGTPYGNSVTTTEHEIEMFLSAKKYIAVYIKKGSELDAIRKRIQDRKSILYQEYNSYIDFNHYIRDLLDVTANKLMAKNVSKYDSLKNAHQELYMNQGIRKKIFDYLYSHSNSTPKDIALALRLSPQAIQKTLKDLLYSGKIVRYETKRKVTYSITQSQESTK